MLYALDVYYQQMFGPDARFVPEDNSYHSKVDYQGVDNNYGNHYYAASSLRNTYPISLPYYDQFHARYRNFGSGWKNLDNIIAWMELATDM